MAKRKGADKEINGILKKYASSENRNGQRRIYKDILGGRFKLTKVVRIDRKDDGNEVHGKIFDYSRNTIENLMKDGYCDALTKIGIQSMKDGLVEIENKNGNLKNDKNLKELKQELQQIEKSIRVENGHDSMIINQLEDFTHKVESMEDGIDHDRSIKEEKALLINTGKQFKEIIIEVKNLNSLPQTL